MRGYLFGGEVGEEDGSLVYFEAGIFEIIDALVHVLDDFVVDFLVLLVHLEEVVVLILLLSGGTHPTGHSVDHLIYIIYKSLHLDIYFCYRHHYV